MKNIKTTLPLFILTAVMLSSCFRLDSNLFNPQTNITEYKFDAYEKSGFYLDESYKIADDKIHLMTLDSDDGVEKTEIYAVYIGDIANIATDTVIMYCHGNFGHMDHYWERAKLLANVGGKNRFGVFMVEYRGFGLSGGSPSESGMYADVDACLQWLKSNGLTDDRLIMYGFSLGGAPSTELTANPRSLTPSKLMLQAPFASSHVMANDASQMALPNSYFTNLAIDNAEEIKKVQQPFFWIHGIDDDFLSMYTHGEVVYKNYQGTYSEAHRIPGADHSDIIPIMGPEKYAETVLNFILK